MDKPPRDPKIEVLKAPRAVRDYGRDWSAWLEEMGDELVASSWSASSGSELALTGSTFTPSGLTSVFVGGGVPGKHRITNHVTTRDGRQDERSIIVNVKER